MGATAIAGLLLLAGPAQSAVSPSRAISPSRLDVEDFAVAMNPVGSRSAVVYQAMDRGSRTRQMKLYARLGNGSPLGTASRLESLRSSSGARISVSAVKVAVAPDGTVTAAWIASVGTHDLKRIRVATAPAGHGFGHPRTVLTQTSRYFKLDALVTGRDGLAVLLWEHGEELDAKVRHGLGAFGAAQRLRARSVSLVPSLAISPSGTVVAVWGVAAVGPAIAARLTPGAHTFLPGQVVNDHQYTAFARAVGGPGGAGVAWTVPALRAGIFSGPQSFARLAATPTGFAPPATIADDGATGAPYVAVPKPGVATAWRHYRIDSNAGEDDQLYDSRLSADASWLDDSATQQLSALPSLADAPAVAAMDDRALIAWAELGSSQERIRLAVAGPTAWQPTQTVWSAKPVRGASVTPIQSTFPDQRLPGGLSIAAGQDGALLAFETLTPRSDGSSDGRLRVASYKP